MNSDHLPLSLSFDDAAPQRGGSTYINFKKANWRDFTRDSEDLFSRLPPPSSCSQGEKEWRRVLQKCSARHIPAGYFRTYAPGIDAASASLIEERDSRRRRDPNDPELDLLNRRISASISATSRQRWMETVGEADRRSNPARYWRLLKNLSGKRAVSTPNQPITFKSRPLTKKSSIANNFVKFYTNIREFKQDKNSRKVYKNIKINNPLDRSYIPFSENDTIAAIKASKNSTAAGPTGSTMLHLKHLGPLGIRYLTHLNNLSVQNADIPSIWKSALIVPILKPGKPADKASSYRPISLLCPEVKVLERMNLGVLRSSLPPASSQHGFRSQHSTVSALLPLANQVADGFNESKPARRTGLLCVDLSKAFDVVTHHKLVEKIGRTDLHPNLKRWLVAYLRDRKVRCLYQGKASKWRKLKMGVPQGSVISPLLFNFYAADVSPSDFSFSPDVDECYADDNHAADSDVDPAIIASNLSRAANNLAASAGALDMDISPAKSSVTLFTPWTRQYGRLPPVSIGADVIPQDNCPKLLGVILDPTWSFSAHASYTAKKAGSRLNILRALADSTFGHDKECLTLTFKSMIRPFFDFAAPIVFPNYSAASLRRLQLVQNKSLRLITGAHSNASIDHLHSETQILPVEQHLLLLSSQYLLRALHPSHPSHSLVSSPPLGPRRMKETLRSKCWDHVEPFLQDGILPANAVKEAMRGIHVRVISDTVDALPPNRVLGTMPPLISPEEPSLPRKTRSVLTQLRSGFCANLNDYQHRIGRSATDQCPDCNQATHSTNHLFECPSNPTALSTSDLWERPRAAAAFLSTLPSFSNLPDPGPSPPPRARRRRRPPPDPPP